MVLVTFLQILTRSAPNGREIFNEVDLINTFDYLICLPLIK